MKDFISKTFGGLTRAYYLRQLFFGMLIVVLIAMPYWMGPPEVRNQGIPGGLIVLVLINLPLYPYSRFIYETAVNYIVGNNLFILPAPMMLLGKAMTMIMCFTLAIFIAPVGLAFLYHHHSKAEKELDRQRAG